MFLVIGYPQPYFTPFIRNKLMPFKLITNINQHQINTPNLRLSDMGRAPCCDKNGLKKGPWTPEEDHKLITYIQTNGPGNWRSLPKNAGLERCGKSCRLRWTNYLRPDIKRGRFSFEEEETIIQLHSILGNKWSAIAARLPGRTDNEIKNYWNTHIRKRLLRNGIDPVTHAPRLDLMDLSSILASALCNSSSSSSSSLLNLSTLQAHALLNPDLLILATTLSSLKHQNQSPPLFSDQQFLENQFPIPPQNSIHHPQFPLVPPQTQQGFPQDTVNSQQGNFTTVIGGGNSENYYSSSGLIQSVMMSDNNNTKQNMGMDDNLVVSPSSLTPQTSSGAPLNSSSTFVNSSSTTDQDERDSYCSSFFKFEIPESLVDFEDFL